MAGHRLRRAIRNLAVAKGIAYSLEDKGYVLDMMHDGATADDFLRRDENDLIVLDVNLPGLDGLSVLRNLRARADQRPVIILTARADVADRIAGLDAGADDYLIKPFDMAELEARIRALLRRRGKRIEHSLTFGPLTFELNARTARLHGKTMELPRRELAVLEVLIRAEGRIVPKSALLEGVYGTGSDVDESAVEAHVSRLRKRLSDWGVEIKAQRGLGYHLQTSATET